MRHLLNQPEEVDPEIDLSDLDREALLRLNYQQLRPFCLVNRYMRSVCDQTFWRAKFARDYVDLGLPTRQVDYEKLYRDVEVILHEDRLGVRSKKLLLNKLPRSSRTVTKADILMLYVIERGYDRLVTWILDQGMISKPDLFFFLQQTMRTIKLSTIAILLERMEVSKPFLRENVLSTAVAVAGKNDRPDIVTYLLSVFRGEFPAEYENAEIEAFLGGAMGGSLTIVKEFWDKMSDWDRKTALTYAAWRTHLPVIEYIVNHGTMPSYELLQELLPGNRDFPDRHSIFKYLFPFANLTMNEIVTLLTNQWSPAISIWIAERLDNETIEANLRLIADHILMLDDITLYRYLVEEKGIRPFISIKEAIEANDDELFLYILMYGAPRDSSQRQEDNLRAMLLEAIDKRASSIVKAILETYYENEHPFDEEELLRYSLSAWSVSVSKYLLARMGLNDQDLKRVVDDLKQETTDPLVLMTIDITYNEIIETENE